MTYILQTAFMNPVSLIKVIQKENSIFLNQFFPTPYLYRELINMIIHTRYINT